MSPEEYKKHILTLIEDSNDNNYLIEVFSFASATLILRKKRMVWYE